MKLRLHAILICPPTSPKASFCSLLLAFYLIVTLILLYILIIIMCVHPISKSYSASNKIADEINEQYTDMDSLSEFAGYCKYLDSGNDLASNQSDLKVLHLNVCSILSKQSDFGKLLSHNKIDVCTINETWLKNDNKHLLKLHDYACITQERKTGKGGGVGIAISKSLKFHRREDLENNISIMFVI